MFKAKKIVLPSKISIINHASFFIFMIIMAIFLFILVDIRMKRVELGYKIEKLEREEVQLEEEVNILSAELASLKRAAYLVQMNQSMKLYLLPSYEWIEKR